MNIRIGISDTRFGSRDIALACKSYIVYAGCVCTTALVLTSCNEQEENGDGATISSPYRPDAASDAGDGLTDSSLYAVGSVFGAALDGSGKPVDTGTIPTEDRLPLPDTSLGPCAFEPAPRAGETASGNVNCPDGVYSGDITITGPAEIEMLAGCSRVAGNVTVQSPTLQSLEGLEGLKVIEGDFTALGSHTVVKFLYQGNEKLSTLRGLDNLRCVGGDMSVGYFAQPAEIGSLSQLVEVEGSFTTYDPYRFPALRRVWGDVSVTDAAYFAYLPSLEVVFGSVWDPASNRPGSNSRKPVDKEAIPSLEYMGCGGIDKPCRDGVLGCDLEARTQADIDKVAACEIGVQGLTISGADILDLTPLSRLRGIRGDLTIRASGLRTLKGLESLEHVDSLYLFQNSLLEDVSALNGLEINTSINISNSTALLSLSGWSELRPRPGKDGFSIWLEANSSLRELGDWPWLNDIKDLTIRNCPLTSLAGLGALKTVRSIDLCGLTSVSSLGGLRALETTESLRMCEFNSLNSLEGLEGLKTVSGRFSLDTMPLRDLNGLSGLQSAGELSLNNLPLLQELTGLTSLDSLGNAEMAQGFGFETFGGIKIANCPNLANLHGLETVQAIDNLFLESLVRLESLEGFPGVKSIREINIYDLGVLKNVLALGKVESVKDVRLERTSALSDLSGLDAVTHISGNFLIVENRALQSLDGLGSLETIDGDFFISANPILRSSHGLSRLNKVGSLEIEANDILPDCEIEWLAAAVGMSDQAASWLNGIPGTCPP